MNFLAQQKTLSLDVLSRLARGHGLHTLTVSDLAPLHDSEKPLNAWQARGYAGEMKYMLAKPEALCRPAGLLPGGRSMVCFAVRYQASAPQSLPADYGRVARYAHGADYHGVLKRRLINLVREVEGLLGGEINFKVFADAAPILERAAAAHCGLGFIGKNSMLIHSAMGSMVFLAELVWDVMVEGAARETVEQAARSCGACRRCRASCPTGAIVEDRVVDARKCISYLTIEKRGAFSFAQRDAIGEWVFGCDVCQEVCPFNHAALRAGSAPDCAELCPDGDNGAFLALGPVLGLRSSAEFKARFSGTAFLRPKREGLVRNALAVAANTGASSLVKLILECAGSDRSPLVRQHALWALWKLALGFGAFSTARLKRMLVGARGDPDAQVSLEACDLLDRV